jgi:cytochrome c553
LAVALTVPTARAGDAAPPAHEPAAASHYGYCLLCHGAQGNGNASMGAPKLAGMEPWYLQRQLEEFRARRRGTRAGDPAALEMQVIAQHLSDADIPGVIAYIATLEPRIPPATVSGDPVRGRALYASCAACHGTHAQGNIRRQAPALRRQADWYLVAQLEHFRSGLRGYSSEDTKGNAMRAAAAALPDDEHAIADVVAYINTLAARVRAH